MHEKNKIVQENSVGIGKIETSGYGNFIFIGVLYNSQIMRGVVLS